MYTFNEIVRLPLLEKQGMQKLPERQPANRHLEVLMLWKKRLNVVYDYV